MRGRFAACAAAALAAAAAPASADSFESLLGQKFKETEHSVVVRIEAGVGRFTVRRVVRHEGELTEELSLSATLPTGAAVTGLRVRAGGRWHDGELLDAAKADERYAALTDIEAERPGDPATARRPPALLGWEAQGQVKLRAYPLRPGQSFAFEYTLVAPPCWADGRAWLDYPDVGGGDFATPAISVRRDPSTSLRANGGASLGAKSTSDEATITIHPPGAAAFPAAVEQACGGAVSHGVSATAIEIAPRAPHGVAARYARFATAAGRAVATLAIDAAAVLEPAPLGARVVFVLDGSHSTRDEGLRDQLALVRGYVAHVPDARVEIVVFRRDAERLLGELAPAAELEARLAELPARRLALGNGSHLDRGLALAANLLAGAPGPARVVIVSDAETRRAFSPELAIAAAAPLPRFAVVHAVLRGWPGGAPTEERNDAGALAPIAAAFGGVQLDVNGDLTDAAAVRDLALGLVRPIRIDHFRVDAGAAAELGEGGDDYPAVLAEGDGRRRTAVVAAAPDAVTLTGMIWGRKFSVAAPADPALGAALPALLFGDAAMGSLDEAEQLAAARLGGAVSAYTSYLSAEDRIVPIPPDADLIAGLGISGHGGVCGCGSYSGGSSCRGYASGVGYGTGVAVEPPRHDEYLRAWMQAGLASCAAAHRAPAIEARLFVEATGDEIVDVRIEGPLSDDVRACLVDAAWEIRLSDIFDRGHQDYATPLYYRTAPLPDPPP